MEKTQPVMVKSCILTMRPLSTFKQMYRFVPSQKVCFLTIDITADPNLIVLGCIWNILRYKYNVYQMPTSGVQHTNWIGSEKVVLGLHFDWNLYLQVWAVDSYTEVFHTGETSVFPYIMLLTPIFDRISKGISEIFEEQTFSLAFVSELRKTKSHSCVRNRDCQLAFES